MQTLEVIFIGSEKLSIAVLGIGQPTGLMMLHRPAQQFGNSGGTAFGRTRRDGVLA